MAENRVEEPGGDEESKAGRILGGNVFGRNRSGSGRNGAAGVLDEELTTWVSPGMNAMVDLGETLDLTLHLAGPADDAVSVKVATSSGSVDPASGSVMLNPQGKAFRCRIHPRRRG